MKRIATIICALCAIITLTSSKPVRVACIGDSITYGAAIEDRENKNYPVVLQQLMGSDYDVRNFGISARVMLHKGDHPYYQEQFYQDVKEFLPDIVTIMLGTNDSKPHNIVYFNEFESDYLEMVNELQSLPSHPRIYVCLPCKINPNPFEINDEEVVDKINPAIKDIAMRKWLDLIDCRTPTDNHLELFTPDGVHPNADGARVIAQTIYEAFKTRGDVGKPGKRVVFIGDSITDDDWGTKNGHQTSERSHYDMNHIYGHGYVMDCAVYYQEKYPSKGYKFYNRGISGNKIADLDKRWDNDVFPVHPDVVSVLVGINDTGTGDPAKFDYSGWEKIYRSMIERTLAFDKDIKLVLCVPFVAQVGAQALNGGFANRSATVARLGEIVKSLAKEYGCVCVDYAEMMKDLITNDKSGDTHYWTWDGIHPTMVGHQKMAELWEKSTAKIMK